jgi:hypothetical protein
MTSPRVTEIIMDAVGNRFEGVNPIVLDRACAFGTAVHATLTLHDRGKLGTYDPQLEGYLAAWKKFRTMYRPKFLSIEERLTDQDLGFTGQPDRIVLMQGQYWVLDFKTGAKSPEQAIQTAAYAHLFCIQSAKVNVYSMRRMCVFLDGQDFKVVEYDNPADRDVFRSMLALYYWKRNNNIGRG